MNIQWNKLCIILLVLIFSGCKSTPPPDPWEEKVVNDLAIPQDSCRVWTVAGDTIRVVYVFQADQEWMNQIHSYIKLQRELNEKIPYYELYGDYILICKGMENDFKEEMEKNPQLNPLVQDFIDRHFRDYKSLDIGREQSENPKFRIPKIRLGIIYKKLSENQYLVIIGMAPPELIPKGHC